jgi:hypothetical protein
MSDKVLKTKQPVELTPEKIAKDKKNEAILDSALPTAFEEQKDSRFFDFDKSLREYKQLQMPLKIKLCNKYFELPRTMPASYFVTLIALSEKNGTKDIMSWKTADLMDIARSVLPKDAYALVMENQVTLDFVIGVLLPKIIHMWQPEVEKEVKNDQEETMKTDGQI